MNGRESKAFNVKVGVHQGSVLSPLLFIIVLEALSREFRVGLSMELLYADDLVLIAKTKELLLEKVRKWKEGMEKKGLRVNAGKTKVMRCQMSMGQVEDSGEHPCGVCRKGVGDNSIFCVECHRWVYKRSGTWPGIFFWVSKFFPKRRECTIVLECTPSRKRPDESTSTKLTQKRSDCYCCIPFNARNSLPAYLKDKDLSTAIFRSKLKTHFFSS